ncbi:hypothetical protein NC651_013986 [Populus alba x Populus x berolinensis]|nr:hypothetical protein NC651_013986 [Populus alba x Populus x berolinensis]
MKAFNSSPFLDLKRQEKKKLGRWRQRRKGCKRGPRSHVSDDKNAISGGDGSTTDLKPSLGSHLRRLHRQTSNHLSSCSILVPFSDTINKTNRYPVLFIT